MEGTNRDRFASGYPTGRLRRPWRWEPQFRTRPSCCAWRPIARSVPVRSRRGFGLLPTALSAGVSDHHQNDTNNDDPLQRRRPLL